MATRSTNTQVEALGKLISDLAEIKQFPDADLPFLIQLETIILQYLRAPLDEMKGGGGGQGGPPGGPGGFPPQTPNQTQRPGGPMPGAQMPGSPGGPGGAPDLDELRRIMPG